MSQAPTNTGPDEQWRTGDEPAAAETVARSATTLRSSGCQVTPDPEDNCPLVVRLPAEAGGLSRRTRSTRYPGVATDAGGRRDERSP